MTKKSETAIIIGGGIIGLACAHYLCEAGYQITVIEKNKVGHGCSYANCGLICPSDVLPLTEPGAVLKGLKSFFNPTSALCVRPQLRLSFYQWMLQFARRCTHAQMIRAGWQLHSLFESSLIEYQKLFEQTQLNAEWKKKGLLYVLQTKHGLKKFKHTEKLLAETYDIKAQAIEGDKLDFFDSAFKSGLAGAFLYNQDSSLRPDKLSQSWHQHLIGKGVLFKESCCLNNIRKTATCITALETSYGDLCADHYIFATGAWSSQLAKLLNCKIPVEPGKGYSITMSKPDQCPQYPMLLPEHGIGITPFNDCYRIASIMEFSGYNTDIPAQRIAQLKASANSYLKTPLGAEVQDIWYGWRPMTWDSLPIVGRVPGLTNSLLATGHNMLGLSLAPVTGKLVTEIIQESSPHIPIEAFSPNRF